MWPDCRLLLIIFKNIAIGLVIIDKQSNKENVTETWLRSIVAADCVRQTGGR